MNQRKPCSAFGFWLDNKLSETGMTEYELADKIGISRVSISNHIHGAVLPHISTIKMYADYFGSSWYVLYDMVLSDSKK